LGCPLLERSRELVGTPSRQAGDVVDRHNAPGAAHRHATAAPPVRAPLIRMRLRPCAGAVHAARRACPAASRRSRRCRGGRRGRRRCRTSRHRAACRPGGPASGGGVGRPGLGGGTEWDGVVPEPPRHRCAAKRNTVGAEDAPVVAEGEDGEAMGSAGGVRRGREPEELPLASPETSGAASRPGCWWAVGRTGQVGTRRGGPYGRAQRRADTRVRPTSTVASTMPRRSTRRRRSHRCAGGRGGARPHRRGGRRPR